MNNLKNIDKSLDRLILVDQNDQKIGEMDKYEAHQHPAKLHRASSVWLMNSKGQVLLQKRSSKKIVGAGWWGNAICGNVRPTESCEECAERRLKEEIGVVLLTELDVFNVRKDLKLELVYKFIYQAYCNEQYGEHEIDRVYVGKYNGEVTLNENEAEEIVWIDFKDLVEQVELVSLSATPEETLSMSAEDLRQKTAPCKIELNGTQQLLSPWTYMMLRDNRLLSKLHAFLP